MMRTVNFKTVCVAAAAMCVLLSSVFGTAQRAERSRSYAPHPGSAIPSSGVTDNWFRDSTLTSAFDHDIFQNDQDYSVSKSYLQNYAAIQALRNYSVVQNRVPNFGVVVQKNYRVNQIQVQRRPSGLQKLKVTQYIPSRP